MPPTKQAARIALGGKKVEAKNPTMIETEAEIIAPSKKA